MIKKIICAAVLAIAPLAVSTESSAGDCYYGGYRGHHGVARTVVRHHSYAPSHHYGGRDRSGYGAPIYAAPYGSYYRSRPYSAYRYGYRGYGSPYYGRGTSIGINRGGVSLYFGF